jgi:hypothetical protein
MLKIDIVSLPGVSAAPKDIAWLLETAACNIKAIAADTMGSPCVVILRAPNGCPIGSMTITNAEEQP